MNSRLSCVLLACFLGQEPAILAQGTTVDVNAHPTKTRVADARRVIPTGPGRVSEVSGVLISDVSQSEIRFEAAKGTGFVVPYASISAMHYEEAKYPRRVLRRSSFYLTIHYADLTDRPAFETIRLLSREDAVSAMTALERDTRITYDRSPATESFLGMPIRAGLGTQVVVTDQAGRTTKGVVTQLSEQSLTLEASTGTSQAFEEPNIRRIRLAYSAKHDVGMGLATGAGLGFGMGYVAAGINCRPNCGDVWTVGGLFASIGGGLGALIGPAIGRLRYPFNDAFDVYRGHVSRESAIPGIAIAPQLAEDRKGVLVSVRF